MTPLLTDRLYYLHLVREVKGGQIIIVSVKPHTDVGFALCSKQVFAALKWRPEETLDQLMKRLDDVGAKRWARRDGENEVDAAVSFTVSRTCRATTTARPMPRQRSDAIS